MTIFEAGAAVQVAQRDYFDLTLATIEMAKRRLWACIFLFDLRPQRDFEGEVLDIALAIAARHRAGIDTRVILQSYTSSAELDTANLSAAIYLKGSGVPARRLATIGDRRGSHAKFLVADDMCVIGSQNWTHDAFRLNIEDAIMLRGAPVNILAAEFERLWAAASEEAAA